MAEASSAATIERERSEAARTQLGSNDKSIWPLLAGLRFLFAFIVLITHVTGDAHIPRFLSRIHQLSAGTAVVCFFLVSGFSIAHSIMERPEGFYKRRIDRIYPVFLVSFLVALIPYALWGKVFRIWGVDGSAAIHMPSIASVIGSAFLLNGFVAHRLEAIGTAWTLSIEVFFYLLAPLFLRMRTRNLLWLMAGSCVLFAAHSFLHIEGLITLMYGAAAPFLLWPWLLGFIFYRHKEEKWAQFMLIALGALMITRWDLSGEPHGIFIYVLSAALIIYAPAIKPRLGKFLNYLGDLSYPMYIIQGPVLCLLLGNNTERPYYVLIGATVLASLIAYHLIDRPYRNRVAAMRKRQLAAL